MQALLGSERGSTSAALGGAGGGSRREERGTCALADPPLWPDVEKVTAATASATGESAMAHLARPDPLVFKA
jgi:hypothetical protein